MKVSKHVEKLLRQGRNPKELVELGFPKSVVTRVHRQLKEEKAARGPKAAKGRAEGKGRPQPPPVSSDEITPIQQRLASLESEIKELETRVEVLEAIGRDLESMEARLDGTPALGIRSRFTCSCGASGFVALHIQCTKCGKETWWGWFPK
jgi:hypothetical protein